MRNWFGFNEEILIGDSEGHFDFPGIVCLGHVVSAVGLGDDQFALYLTSGQPIQIQLVDPSDQQRMWDLLEANPNEGCQDMNE